MPEPSVTFSVIIPTYNRLHLLRKTLDSLFEQDYKDFEVIVVNDGGTDGTTEFLRELNETGGIRSITQENSGLAASRRAGLALARGRYVAFTDDDCVLPADWLRRLHAAFSSTGADGVGGATVTGNPENIFARVTDIMHNHFKRLHAARKGAPPFLTGNNVAYRREAVERAGGPDPRYRMGAEDRDLAYRVAASGGAVIFDPQVVVRHHTDVNFFRYLRQQYRYGIGSYLLYSRSGADGGGPAPSPISAYLGLPFAPFRETGFPSAVVFAVLIVLGQAAVAAGYLSQKFRRVPDRS